VPLGALDWEGLLKQDKTFPGGSFAPSKKGAKRPVKPSRTGARSGWYRSTVKVFRRESGWRVPFRQYLRLPNPCSKRSESCAAKAVRGES